MHKIHYYNILQGISFENTDEFIKLRSEFEQWSDISWKIILYLVIRLCTSSRSNKFENLLTFKVILQFNG